MRRRRTAQRRDAHHGRTTENAFRPCGQIIAAERRGMARQGEGMRAMMPEIAARGSASVVICAGGPIFSAHPQLTSRPVKRAHVGRRNFGLDFCDGPGTFPNLVRQGSSVVEQRTHKPLVAGSIPAPGTKYLQNRGGKGAHNREDSWANSSTPAAVLSGLLPHEAKLPEAQPRRSARCAGGINAGVSLRIALEQVLEQRSALLLIELLLVGPGQAGIEHVLDGQLDLRPGR